MDINLIGQRIKLRREQRGISAEELAEEIGVHKATIHRYENGDFKSVKLPYIEAIAKYLEVSPAWLIGKTDDPTPESYPLPERDQRDVARILETTQNLLRQKDLTLDGKPASEESIQTILDSIALGLDLARKRNRQTK